MPEGKYEHLRQADEEINGIDEILRPNQSQENFVVERRQHIVRDSLVKLLNKEFDIIHFTGHGDPNGLVFEDETPIPEDRLVELFQNHKIQLLFLNACYSSNQVNQLKKLNNIRYIITNNNEISETLASNFAFEFYKEYNNERNIPRAFYNAFLQYRINYTDTKYHMQEICPDDEYKELLKTKQALPPIYQKIFDDKIKIIQTKPIPSELMKKIENTISAFDEDILLSNDTAKFWKELKNISEILSTLTVYSLEYISNIDPKIIQDQKQVVDELIEELKEVELLLKRKKRVEVMEKVNKEIIIQIFKKIYFNITTDSIQKLTPLLPEELDYEFFGDMIGMMYSILKPLNLLREKINQSFVAYDKLYNDSFYNEYLMNRCLDIIDHIDIDYNDFRQVIKDELQLDIDSINDKDAIEVGGHIEKIREELQDTQKQEKEAIQKQEQEALRNLSLSACLENISNAEKKIANLFRKIILKGLEYKRKSSYLKTINPLDKKTETIDNEMQIHRSYEDIDILEEKLIENTNFEDPQLFLPVITALINKIGKEYRNYSTEKDYPYEDIYSCFKKMDKTLRDVIDNIDSDVLNNNPYIFPEISELSNYWKFRLNALQRKDARQKYIMVNNYFSNKLYGEVVSKSKIDKNNQFNAKSLNKIGIAQMYLGKYSEAIETFRKIHDFNTNTNALYNSGLAFQELALKDSDENTRQALTMFEKVIKLDERHVDALVSLGILNFKIRDYGNASKYIKMAIKVSEDDDWRVLLAMGCILSDSEKDYKNARRYFEMCEALNPNSILVNLNKSQNLILLKEHDEGEKVLTRIKEKIGITGDESTGDNVIEDRSTRIIMNILLICLHYLKGNEAYAHSETLIKDLLRLLDLKDSKLVEWNFINLKEVIDKEITSKDDKDFLTSILSIPGEKPEEDIEALKKKILDYLVKNNQQFDNDNIQFISDNNVEKIVKIKTTPIDKSKDHETQWYHWSISLDLSELAGEGSVEYVVYTFDPTFRDTRDESDKKILPKDVKEVKDGIQNFPISVIGWKESKFEIELKRNGSILKMVSKLSP